MKRLGRGSGSWRGRGRWSSWASWQWLISRDSLGQYSSAARRWPLRTSWFRIGGCPSQTRSAEKARRRPGALGARLPSEWNGEYSTEDDLDMDVYSVWQRRVVLKWTDPGPCLSPTSSSHRSHLRRQRRSNISVGKTCKPTQIFPFSRASVAAPRCTPVEYTSLPHQRNIFASRRERWLGAK